MGFNQIENKLIFDRSQDWIQVDHCRISFPKNGNQGVCSVIEEVTIEPESAVFIHANNPLATLKDPESVARIENLGTGFLHENVITITEGIYTNSEYTSLEILNPWPYSITIPKGTEVARAITMEEKNGQLQCNELVEILSKNITKNSSLTKK